LIAGATKANVAVRVRRGIVQIERKGPGIRPIIPIAAP